MTTLFQWPDAVPGLGPRAVVPFATCADCPAGIHKSVSGTFVAYGGRPLCLPCARRRVRDLPKEAA